MLRHSLILAALVIVAATASAQSNPNAYQPKQTTAPTLIANLFCSNAGAAVNSTTTVVYTGMFMGVNYFNLTTVSNVAVPTTQQAALTRTSQDASGITFELRTVLTNQTLHLHLVRGTLQGSLATGAYAVIPMTCSSNIVKI